MAIALKCPNPHCNRALRAPDGDAGKRARCPACSRYIRIPSRRACAAAKIEDVLRRICEGPVDGRQGNGTHGSGALHTGTGGNGSHGGLAVTAVSPAPMAVAGTGSAPQACLWAEPADEEVLTLADRVLLLAMGFGVGLLVGILVTMLGQRVAQAS